MIVVLYHGNCPDGFTAAWSISKKHPDARFIAVHHKEMPPDDVYYQDVIIIDFCYPRDIMMHLKENTKSLLVLDHHASAEEKCGDLEYCYFDMFRSGAGLGWDHFNGKETRPWLVSYIEYRDLGGLYRYDVHPWPNYAQVMAAVDSYERTFENWDILSQRDPKDLAIEGLGIERYQRLLVSQLARNAEEIELDGMKVLVVNTPILQSEVGTHLATLPGRETTFAGAWYQGRHDIKFSLRSGNEGRNVIEVAERFGGGGHEHAAGFGVTGLDVQSLLERHLIK